MFPGDELADGAREFQRDDGGEHPVEEGLEPSVIERITFGLHAAGDGRPECQAEGPDGEEHKDDHAEEHER